jgi:queuine tRNA-ribosyltransferase
LPTLIRSEAEGNLLERSENGREKFFTLEAVSGTARAGTMRLEHGEVQTPVFMPVGTRASVKTLSQADLEELDAKIILGNTYHLFLKPGHNLIEEVAGDLHQFMDWKRCLLTDSGGYQVFSLAKLRKIAEEGVTFQSHIDGSRHLLSPEKSMEIQKALGSDIVMAFDECPALPSTEETMRASIARTGRWAARCKQVELRSYQKLFGIIQGGLDVGLRRESLDQLLILGFDGYALGGLSVGEKNEEMVSFCEQFVPEMPADSPRYLMGVGKPLDVLNGIKNGLDMFDCVLPTRNARNGQVFTKAGPLNIKKARFARDTAPLDPHCSCKVCRRYSRAYLHHLFKVGEYLAGQLFTFHNINFYLEMTRQARAAILQGKFDEFFDSFYKSYSANEWLS